MSAAATIRNTARGVAVPWVLQIRAFAIDDPELLAGDLRRAIRENGGWNLRCQAGSHGFLKLLFEFERGDCMEIYGALMACGLELSAGAHRNLTQLCQCNRFRSYASGAEPAVALLEVETLAAPVLHPAQSIPML